MLEAKILRENPFPWLLEELEPGVPFLAHRLLLDTDPTDAGHRKARDAAYREGPITVILDEMHESGYWEKPGPGYNPKYRSSVWALICLAQLGASKEYDSRISIAIDYILDNALAAGGQFTSTGAPSGTVDCLQGNLCAALLDLGCEDPRLELAFEWLARTVTGEGIAPATDRAASPRYYGGKCGPIFCCGANNKLPCAWGGVKVMLALSKLPVEKRTPLVESAIQQGVEFFFSVDPAQADYPTGWTDKPSGNWWKFGFPVFYVTDILQIIEALAGLGYGEDPRLANALNLVNEKKDDQGRWKLEYDYTGKTWVDFGRKKEPNKWVTIRALHALKLVQELGTIHAI